MNCLHRGCRSCAGRKRTLLGLDARGEYISRSRFERGGDGDRIRHDCRLFSIYQWFKRQTLAYAVLSASWSSGLAWRVSPQPPSTWISPPHNVPGRSSIGRVISSPLTSLAESEGIRSDACPGTTSSCFGRSSEDIVSLSYALASPMVVC
jgi:hypothetical protein